MKIPMFRAALGSILLVLPLALACNDREGASQDARQPATNEPPASGQLPPSHPPIEGARPSGIAPVPPQSGTESQALTWSAPEAWIAEPPSSSMRRAQYRVPGKAGEAECVVYYFGPGQGGDATANAIRWAQQFTQPGGHSSEEVLETRRLEVNGVSVLLAEITGTYSGGAMMGGPSQSLPDYMLLGAIAEGSDANWFFKFTGPEKTVAAHRAAFESMIQSIQVGG